MDVKLLATTFLTILVAELGDKTQLATFCFSASSSVRKWEVFLGASGALVLTSLIAVLAGAALGRALPTNYVRIAAGALFIAVGLVTLWGAGGLES